VIILLLGRLIKKAGKAIIFICCDSTIVSMNHME